MVVQAHPLIHFNSMVVLAHPPTIKLKCFQCKSISKQLSRGLKLISFPFLQVKTSTIMTHIIFSKHGTLITNMAHKKTQFPRLINEAKFQFESLC